MIKKGEVSIKILECSSKGDKRFSAFYAKVKAWGKVDSIENHYQMCKRFGDYKPSNWKDAKGKQPTHIELNGKEYDLKYLSHWYKMLWVNYLDNQPELVEYAKGFDEYNDIFKGKSLNCQADVIRQYIKQGRQSLVAEYQDLMDLFRGKNSKPTETKVINKHHNLSYDINIGRPSKWGNPFSHMDNTKAEYKVDTREEAVEKYREWILNQPHLLADLHELKGKTLGCYCKPKSCHGDVLVELVDKLGE